MDDFLQQSWRAARPPFDGETLHLPDLIELDGLQDLLRGVVAGLRARFDGSELRCFHDWHEHDGFVSTSRAAAWDELAAEVRTAQTLYAARASDEYVRTGYYEASGGFYLRIWVPDEEAVPGQAPLPRTRERTGDFDLTGPSGLVRDLARALAVSNPCTTPAKRYFDEQWGG